MATRLISLWAVLGLIAPAVADVKFFPRYHVEDAEEHASPHFAHNPHRQLLSRSLTTNTDDVQGRSFDFVIAGGGCGGLALAARLSEWSNTTVLVIEAGGDGSEYQERIDVPGMFGGDRAWRRSVGADARGFVSQLAGRNQL
jgi:hypothetical protein